MIDSLINNASCIEDKICNYCIEALKIISDNIGITYGQLNVYLFLVYIPLLILIFMILSVVNYKYKYKLIFRITKLLIWINIILFIVFVINFPLI